MDDDLKALIREIGRVVLAERRLKMLELLIYTSLAVGVSLWALLTLRYTFSRYFGL